MLNRAVIYLSDHVLITGKSGRQAQRDFKKIREKLNIENVNYIGIETYLKYTGLSPDDIKQVLKGRN